MGTRDGIRIFRDRMRWNQVELAEKLGIVQGNITAWESGRGTPSFQISKKLLEMGITVEELFGVEYNEMHKLWVQKASPASSSETPKKLNVFEADLLRKMLDKYASLDIELESIKDLKELYKLEREIERGDNTTDLVAKKQRLQKLQEQIENEIWSFLFDAKKEIKSLEEKLEQMEDMERRNSYEKPDIRLRILKLQEVIESQMYSYVYSELKKLTKQEPANEKIRKFQLKQELQRLEERMKRAYDAVEQNAIIEQMNELEEELAGLENGG